MYQKAYVEFFVSPEDLPIIAEVVKRHSNLSMYAVDSSRSVAELGSSSSSGPAGKGVTAVTWGVFPDREIIQPTIFDPGGWESND